MIHTTILRLIIEIILGLLILVVLHELTHFAANKLCRVRTRYFFITRQLGIGWMPYTDEWVDDNLKVIIIHLSPMIWCLLIFVNPDMYFFWVFLIGSLVGSVIDIYYVIRILFISKGKRKEWLDKVDKNVMKTVVWKRKIDD